MKKTSMLFLMVLWVHDSYADGVRFVCPSEVNVKDELVLSLPDGWEQSGLHQKDGKYLFFSAYITYADKPDTSVMDVEPEDSKVASDREVYRADVSDGFEYKLVCSYGAMKVHFHKKLSASLKSCSTTFVIRGEKRVSNETVCQ